MPMARWTGLCFRVYSDKPSPNPFGHLLLLRGLAKGSKVSWRKTIVMILFAPIMVGLLVFLALMVILKLPMFCCERWRAVRCLPYLGAVYSGLIVPASL